MAGVARSGIRILHSTLNNWARTRGCQKGGDNLSSFCRQFTKSLSFHATVSPPSQINTSSLLPGLGKIANTSLSTRCLLLPSSTGVVPSRNKIYYSLNKGKPKTVSAVPNRFYRLQWGGWIRTKAGRNRHLWKKSPSCKYRLRQHVFCNKTQSKLLDKMTSRFYKMPKYYVNNPYEHYEQRTFERNFPQKTRPFFP